MTVQAVCSHVAVQSIFPGNISSPGHVNEDKTKPPVTFILEESDPVQTELQAASAAIAGLERGNYMTPTNWLGQLMRFGSLGGAPRDNIVVDTLGSWIAAIVWLFMVPDLEGKVWGWGKKEGMAKFRPNAQ